MQNWEYVDYFYSDLPKKSDLDQYGADSWELVTIIATESETSGKGYLLYLKRPISK